MATVLESSQKRVYAAFRLIDAYAPNRVPFGKIQLLLNDAPVKSHRTDDGYICVLEPLSGTYTVSIEGEFFFYMGPSSFDADAHDPDEAVFELTLTPLPRYPFPPDATLLEGNVLDFFADLIPDVTVSIEVNGNQHETRTDSAGRYKLWFDLEGASDAQGTVQFSKTGYLPDMRTVMIAAGKPTVRHGSLLNADAAASFNGTLNGSDGQTVVQGVVEYVEGGVVVQSDAFGNYNLTFGLTEASAPVTIKAVGSGYAESSVSTTALRGQTVAQDFSLTLSVTPGETVEFTFLATDFDDVPISGVLVELIERNRSAYTDADGNYVFYLEDVGHAEPVSFRFSKPGLSTSTGSVEIYPGQVRSITRKLW